MISSYILIFIKFLLGAIFIILFKFLLDYFYIKYRFRNIPSIAGLPFLGVAWELLHIPIEDQQEWFTEIGKEFKGKVFVIWMGMSPMVNLQKPEQMEIILPSTTNIKKSKVYDMITPWLGNGLLTSTGKQWFHQRRLLTPAFHFGVLEHFTEVIFEKAEILNDCLKKYVHENPEKSLDIFSFASKFTLDVICETAMSVDMDAQRKPASEYSNALHEFSNLVMYRYTRPWYMSDFIYSKTEDGRKFKKNIKIMHEFTMKVIKERLDKRAEDLPNSNENEEDEFVFIGKRRRKAFLDLLLEASENDDHPLTIEEIREQVDTIMFAGHDTTATAISWTLFALGNAPDIQEKVQEELCEVFASDINKLPTAVDLTQLKYLDRVIKEVLRLYPSAPFIFRELCEDTEFEGHKIPEGTSVAINIYDLHRDPEIWDNPLEFNPDRFLLENLKDRNPYSYIPFSAGPRNCLGQKFAVLELKIALISILRRWCVKSVKAPEKIKLQSDLILRSCEPIQLHLTPFNNK